MIPNDALIRRIPAFIAEEQRLRIEAIVFASDAIAACLDDVRAIANNIGDKIDSISRSQRTRIFICAWTIVDGIHAIRNLMQSLHFTSAKIQDFIEKYESATLLRNKFDHLNQNVENLAQSQRRRPPIFGALSYCYLPPTEVQKVREGANPKCASLVTLTTGKIRTPWGVQMFNPLNRDVTVPVGGFQFEAFDQTIVLEEAVDALEAVVLELNDGLNVQITDIARQLSKDSGKSVDELMRYDSEGLHLSIEIEFPDA